MATLLPDGKGADNMARRNHSRRVHAPYYDDQGLASAEDYGRGEGGRREAGTGESWGDAVRWGEVEHMVSNRPGTSLATAFGIGFGLGLLITLLLSREEEQSWYDRYAPEAVHDLPEQFRHAKHRLSDTMSDTFKQAGESLASYVPGSWKRW